MYVRTSFKYSFFFSFKNEHLKDKKKNITFLYYFLSFIYIHIDYKERELIVGVA
jgi:hypothetical protein